MVGLTVPPLLLSFAIDDGLRRGSDSKVWMWAGILLCVGLVIAVLAILRHRTMTKIRIYSAQQTIRVAAEQSVGLGSSLQRKVAAGEIAAIGAGDAWMMAQSLTATGPGVGAVVAFVVIAVELLRISPLLAVIILIGTPVLLLVLGPLLDRFRAHGTEYRSAQGRLSGRVVDIVAGLRVLNTLGGKSLFAERWEVESEAVRRTGYRLASTQSWIQGISVGLPALFLAVIVWIAARMTAQGDISVGDLVAVYGFVAVIVVPIASFIEAAIDINYALISARRVVDFLAIKPQPHGEEPLRDQYATLHDPVSGLSVEHGQFAAVATSDRLGAKEIVDRLAGIEQSDASWGGQRLADIDPAYLRPAVLPLDDGDFLFAGTLREVIFPMGNDTQVTRDHVAHTSAIDEMIRGLTGGWDAEVELRGSNFSGGQRQRLRLARALAATPQALLAMDPLSALDAVTESLVVERVKEARRELSTVVFSGSATVLGAADVVHLVEEGRVVASGTHHSLVASNASYRAIVSSDAGNEEEEER